MVGSGMVCQAIPYREGFGAKQVAWLVHSAVVGSVIAPLTLLGGPLMIRAACYTAGVVGGNVIACAVLYILSYSVLLYLSTYLCLKGLLMGPVSYTHLTLPTILRV